jgi:hypothetical protein
MFGEGEAEAENVDELKERRGEIAGSRDAPGDEVPEVQPREDDASFYPDSGAYPARGELLPPTGEMGDPSPTDALQPEPEAVPEELERESDR